MRIVPVEVLSDNYAYLLLDEASGVAAAVDPAQAGKVAAALADAAPDVRLTHVLTTHKHADHAGGNADMLRRFPEVAVVGGVVDDVEACNMTVDHDSELEVGSIRIRCILTPGHTMGHICYFCTDTSDEGSAPVVFTGDTLFIGGAGKFFEGTAEDMYPSLYERLMDLPDDTLVYCGHEYTLANYRFAVSVDGDNEDLQAQVAQATEQRNSNQPTIPSTIGTEKATNPFLRANDARVREAAGCSADDSALHVLARLREMKNNFRG